MKNIYQLQIQFRDQTEIRSPHLMLLEVVRADRAGDRLRLPLTVTAWPPSHLPEL